MENVFSLLSTLPSLSIPQTWAGRLIAGIGWLLMAALIIALQWYLRKYNKPRTGKYWAIWIILALVTPITSLFIGFRLSAPEGLSIPYLPSAASIPVLMIFSALPWMLAGGLLGTAGAASIAVIAGVFTGLWNTHGVFTPLELALLATLFSAAMMQRYRTPFYRLLQHPLFAAFLLSLFYPFVFIITATIGSDNGLAVRLDYALSQFVPTITVVALELLIAGLICEVVSIGVPAEWGSHTELLPSPAERSLRARFLLTITPLILVLLLTLVVGDWIITSQAARGILRGRMRDSALISSRGIPYFMDVGQHEISLLVQDPQLLTTSPEELSSYLGDYVIHVPFFSQFVVLDSSGDMMAEYPEGEFDQSSISPEELAEIQFVLQGVPHRVIAIDPKPGSKTAQASFISRIADDEGETWGVLLARTDLEINPFTLPILANFQSLDELEGDGMLLDEYGRIVYHTDEVNLMLEYTGHIPEGADFFDEPGPDGTRQWVYYQPTEGRPWAVVLTVPAKTVLQIALDIASPLMVMIALVAVVTVIFLSLSLNRITSSLRGLAEQAGKIARGQLDEPLNVSGEDEVGQLRRSFEKMRQSLKDRLDELNRLLAVVQGVAANLDMGEAVKPVLESALIQGASSAHVVLDPAMMPEMEGGESRKPVVYAAGVKAELYSYLNEQVVNLTQGQDRLVLNNVLRPRLLRFQPTDQRPEALMAVALRHEQQYYGALWVAYHQPHTFSEEEVRFMVTLAGQAALAAANASLYLKAEIGRQRMKAILTSTPEPVLVTDQNNRLLLANPAAWRALGLGAEWEEGKPIKDLITQKDLLDLLDSETNEKRSVEITLADNRTYYATASSVIADGHRVGRVCVLRDITTFKELDSLKSEFVATVSHDLRQPLTLVRGYASMLEIVGEMNDQQKGFVRMIITAVENMSRLVINLLDLGRIEAGVGLKLEIVSVQDIIDSVINALQIQATQQRIQMSVEIPANTVPLIEADQALLQQALQNLVDNAIKYTQPGGKVQVRTEVRHNQMVFIVRDTGIGISPIDQPRIFEKFYRGAQAGAKRLSGAGLGLAIVKSIAERHGGGVWVEGQLGKGSTFYLAIPIQHPKQPN